jgi:hypothetical protein
MKPPFLARALVAAAAPPVDYESVDGDLYEEYAQHAKCTGRAFADRWYWSQAIRSLPSLLSYSRSRRSLGANLTTAAIVAFALVAMLLLNEVLYNAIFAVYRTISGIGAWPFFLAGWLDAAFFGALIAALVRSQGVRLALIASLVLLISIAIPILLGFSSPLTLRTWLLLLGAIPAMGAGAGVYQVVRRR